MLQVLAAINSLTKYGIGDIFAFLQKNKINGVKVRIIMSFDVNIVRIDTKIYSVTNNETCDFLTLTNVHLAKCAKNPSSSRNIEISDIERNKTKIFIGFIPPLFVNELHHSPKVSEVNKTIMAPIKATIQ